MGREAPMMLILKALTRRRARSALSILGVAVGIATIIAFISISNGFQLKLNEHMARSGAQLIAFSSDAIDIGFSKLAEADIRVIKEIRIDGRPAVVDVSRTNFFPARGLGGGVPAMLLYGHDPGERLIQTYEPSLNGRLIKAHDEIMLGFLAAEKLGKKPGDTLSMLSPLRTFKIVGVYATGIRFEDAGAVVHLEVIQELAKSSDAANYGFIYLRDPAQLEVFRAAAREKLPGLIFQVPIEFTRAFEQISYIDWFVWIVSIIAVAVGALGVLNTMMMSVSERVREIGVLRAVGWSSRRVTWMIICEGLLISVLGGAVGLGLGVLAAEVVIHGSPPGLFMQADYSMETFAKATLVAIGVGFIGAAFPAYQASRLLPAVALRYE